MKSLRRIKLILIGLMVVVLTGCGEYIPDSVVYTEVPNTHIIYVYEYPRYRHYYRVYSIKERRYNPRINHRSLDNRNTKPRRR